MRRFHQLAGFSAILLFAMTFANPVRSQTAAPKKSSSDSAAQSLNQLLSAAQDAVDHHDYQTAATSYKAYLEKKPDDATVHYDLGYVYAALKQTADAKSEFQKAISLNPKMGPAYMNLGLTLLPSDAQAAIDPLKHAVELMPDQEHPRLLLGVALEKSGKLPEAIEQYQAAEKLDPNDFEVKLSLGRALEAAHRPADAESELRAALGLHKDSAEAHLELAHVLVAEKKQDAAADELAAYLALQPNDASARIDRASLLVGAGKLDDALAELDRAASSQPEDLRALQLRAQIYWQRKQFDQALPVLQKAAALAPQDPNIAALLGHVYVQKKLYPNAVQELSIAYHADPKATDVLVDLITVEYQVKNYSTTLQLLDALAKEKDLPAESWFIRASCYDNLDQPVQALDAYRKFLALNKNENSDMYFAATERARVLARDLKDKKR
jgi:tetratricopeptide (TPR) repeat protein